MKRYGAGLLTLSLALPAGKLAAAEWLATLACARQLEQVRPVRERSDSFFLKGEYFLTSVERLDVETLKMEIFLIVVSPGGGYQVILPHRGLVAVSFQIPHPDPRRGLQKIYLRYRHDLVEGHTMSDFSLNTPVKGLPAEYPMRPVRILAESLRSALPDAVSGRLRELVNDAVNLKFRKRDLLLGNVSLCRYVQARSEETSRRIRRDVDELELLSPRLPTSQMVQRLPASN